MAKDEEGRKKKQNCRKFEDPFVKIWGYEDLIVKIIEEMPSSWKWLRNGNSDTKKDERWRFWKKTKSFLWRKWCKITK